MKTVYCLRIRESDEGDWSEPMAYKTQKERDEVAAFSRITVGLRAWSYEQKMTVEEAKELFDE